MESASRLRSLICVFLPRVSSSILSARACGQNFGIWGFFLGRAWVLVAPSESQNLTPRLPFFVGIVRTVDGVWWSLPGVRK